jgi:5-methylcytosine-specific restriction endonuclease McrA
MIKNGKYHKDEILRLRTLKCSYREIVEALGCSLSTVAYHCGKGQKQKTQNRKAQQLDYEVKNSRNCSRFFHRDKRRQYKAPKVIPYCVTMKEADRVNRMRLKNFSTSKEGTMKLLTNIQKVKQKYNISEASHTFTCVYTGDTLDWKDPGKYQYDHITPKSRGGEDTLENLQIISVNANQAKGSMTHDEFIDLCKKVSERHG